MYLKSSGSENALIFFSRRLKKINYVNSSHDEAHTACAQAPPRAAPSASRSVKQPGYRGHLVAPEQAKAPRFRLPARLWVWLLDAR